MVFSNPAFILGFLPCFLLAYWAAPARVRLNVLTLFSYLFYAWWDIRDAPLLLVSTLINYWFGAALAKSNAQTRRILIAGVTVNLLLLGFFKYATFVLDNTTWLAARLGFAFIAPKLEVPLPPGISFFTFHGIAYLVDIQRGAVAPERSFKRFACYFAMFPHLVAGPIVRYSHLAEQLIRHRLESARSYAGIQIFVIGLCKKVLIADRVAVLPDAFYSQLGKGTLGSLDAVVALLAYAIQIYFDFSGYSDMAVGLGKICGFDFPINFDSPYRSRSISEFWRRWHISLSSWLRDYLYIPLGGSRGSAWRTYRNLILTMLLGGLWHGAGWNWVLWGGLHGAGLALERALGDRNPLRRVPAPLQVLTTFAVTTQLWIFFRAPTLSAALDAFGILYGRLGTPFHLASGEHAPLALCMLAIGCLVAFVADNTNTLPSTPRWSRTLAVAMAFATYLLFAFGAVSHPFLYFQF